MTGITRLRKALAESITQPFIRLLARTPVTPNAITWVSFGITVAAAVLAGTGHLFAAGWVVLFAGLLDMLDGALARTTHRVTRFGGVLDSTLDRLSEAALLLGLLVVYAWGQMAWECLLVGLALVGSLMVSYVRARVEAAGSEGKEGLLTRPERVIILVLGLLLSRFDYILVVALAIIAVLSFFTVGQRLYLAHKALRRE